LLAGKYLFARKFDSRFSSCLNLPLPDEMGHKFLELPSRFR